MKRFALGVIIGLGIAGVSVFAVDILVPASEISYSSEYTNKTNVADALDDIFKNLEESSNIPNFDNLVYICNTCPNPYTIQVAGLYNIITLKNGAEPVVLVNNNNINIRKFYVAHSYRFFSTMKYLNVGDVVYFSNQGDASDNFLSLQYFEM